MDKILGAPRRMREGYQTVFTWTITVGLAFLATLPVALCSPQKPTQKARIPAAWSHVDFKNFTYPTTGYCAKEFNFGKSVQVKNGEFKNSDGDRFLVSKIYFGDLTAEGQSEAVVSAGCDQAGAANPGAFTEVLYVYRLQNGRPDLLTAVYPHELPTGGESLFDVTGVAIEGGLLTVENFSGEARAIPVAYIKRKFRWDGQRFVLVGKTRRPYQ